MASPRWTKVRRDLWLHKARTVMVVLAVAVGIAGAGAVLDTWALLRVVVREEYLATNPPSATLWVDSVDAGLLATVRALPGVRAAVARRTVVATATSGGVGRTAMLFAGSDLGGSEVGRVVREAGDWPPGEGGFVLEASSESFVELAIGDSVALRLGSGAEVVLPVTGIARDAGLAPGWMEHIVYGFLTPGTLARLGAPATFDQLQITVREGEMDRSHIRRVAADVAEAVSATGRRVESVEVPEPGEHIHAAQMDSLLLTQGAFGALALLLSAVLVINLVTAMLAGQVREIGIMKAVGARAGQVAAMYMVVALALGLVAALVAIPLGAVAARAYARFAAELLNFSVEGYRIPSWALVAQLGVAAILPMAAAAIPIVRGCRIPVAEALRDLGISGPGERGPGRILGGLGGAARPFLLSLRNAFRRRQRMALTLATLALGGAVFMASLDLRTTIRGSVGELFGKSLRYDMSLRFVEPHAPDSIVAAIRATEGVGELEAWSGVTASVRHDDGLLGNGFSLTGLAWDSRLVAFPPLEGRWLREDDGRAMVVSRRLAAEEPGLRPGATVTLVVGGKESVWSVVGIVDMGPGATAFTSRAAVAETVGDARARVAVLSATVVGTASESELIQRLRRDLEDAGFPVESGQLVQASRVAMEDHLLMVAGFLVLMSQLTIVVGGLALASTMSLSVMERTREIGVLRAIGARHRTIALIIQGEGLVVAVLSWALAVPLSVPMSVAVAKSFGRVMLPVPAGMAPQAGAVLAWLGLVVVVSALACAWPARSATRITTAQALAYE
ncbi:MAG TPA: ABC transporter permease [Longimicrobiales bacterium]|nr:ABC transporter permease [Longimicrobiales bacterium]